MNKFGLAEIAGEDFRWRFCEPEFAQKLMGVLQTWVGEGGKQEKFLAISHQEKVLAISHQKSEKKTGTSGPL